jgi:hypothetical protein
MRTVAALFFCFVFAVAGAGVLAGQHQVKTPDTAPGDTHFSIHNIRSAHGLTLGAEAKVGILAHSFELGSHPELYSGGKDFSVGDPDPRRPGKTHRGYWMALTLHEVAPEAGVYALDIPTKDDLARVAAMVRALEWAVEQDLDVVTYCGGDLSPGDREILDPALERAVKAGVVVVFLDYPHPLNLLPGGFGAPTEPGARAPDLEIFSYDCTALLANQLVAFTEPDDDAIQKHRPFLARPSIGPVTAGLVALLRSVEPEMSPAEIKKVLVETSRSLEYRGQLASRVPDAFQAVTRVAGVGPA